MDSVKDRSKNISIVRVIYEFYPLIGGSITHTLELSENINPYLKSQIIFAADFGQKCKEFDQKFHIKICRVKKSLFSKEGLSASNLSFLFYYSNIFFKLNKMAHPDILHFHGIWGIFYGSFVGRLLGIPVVGMLHGSASAYSKRGGFFETVLAKISRPNHVFVLDDGSNTPSKFRKIWGDKVTIVYHGIDSSYLTSFNDNNMDILQKHGLRDSDFIIVSTSSLIPVKNIDLLIKSFSIFIKENSIENAYLLIAGEGYLYKSLTQLIKDLKIEKNVIFLSGVEKNLVIKYLSVSDVFAATSLYSNMNRSTLEAMACEKPVIVFDNGTIDQLITHMENGVLVKSGDLISFAHYLKLLYKDSELRLKLGIDARKTIIKERSWERRIHQELEVYKRLLKNVK